MYSGFVFMETKTGKIPFIKYSGAGNDFIIMDGDICLTDKQIRNLCDRTNGIGADGLILIKPSLEATFKMIYYNADGLEASFCGNGTRCVAHYTKENKLWSDQCTIETADCLVACFENMDGMILVEMPPFEWIEGRQVFEIGSEKLEAICVKCGVPHWIAFVDDVGSWDVDKWGAFIRKDTQFIESGANVNFVEVISPEEIKVRTYERGVEAETLACGSGCAVASHVFSHLTDNEIHRVVVETQSNQHLIFLFHDDQCLMSGPADPVFKGSISLSD